MAAVAPSWAAIFDWDGVVVDSAAPHEESWNRLAREEGRALPPGHFKRGFGMKNEHIIPNLLGWASDPADVRRLSDRKEALYRQIVGERGLTVLPGAVELISALSAAGVPCAIASSTPRENLDCALERMDPAVRRAFKAIVSSQDVTRGKPDPQVFLLAAERLATPPKRCVVFEDTLVGIEAAHAAGMKVVAVATTNPRESLTSADRVVDRLSEVSVESLARWFE